MKAISVFLFAISFTIVVVSCNQHYGKEYKLDKKHNIYYKGDGVDEALVKKLAEYLKEQEYFQDSISSTVQLIKNKDTFTLNFVVDTAKLTSAYDNTFLVFGGFISEKVFDKKPVIIQLTNLQLEPFKNLGYAKPISDFDK